MFRSYTFAFVMTVSCCFILVYEEKESGMVLIPGFSRLWFQRNVLLKKGNSCYSCNIMLQHDILVISHINNLYYMDIQTHLNCHTRKKKKKKKRILRWHSRLKLYFKW